MSYACAGSSPAFGTIILDKARQLIIENVKASDTASHVVHYLESLSIGVEFLFVEFNYLIFKKKDNYLNIRNNNLIASPRGFVSGVIPEMDLH